MKSCVRKVTLTHAMLEQFVNDSIVAPSRRKGQFTYIIADTKVTRRKIAVLLKMKMPVKRGVYAYKGIVVLSTETRREFFQYFDEVIKINVRRNKNK